MAWNEPGPGRDPWSRGPQGGRKGPELPDLAKLLKKLSARFGRGGGTGGGKRMPSGGLAGLVIVVVIVAWLFSGFYTVDAQQRGVVLRFGAVAGVAHPGLGWHAPWPVGSVILVNMTKLRQASTQDTLMTKDHNLVDVGLTVQFRVSSARAYLFKVSDPDDTVAQAAKSALRSVVSGYTVSAVLGDAQQEIGVRTKQLLQQTLDGYQCGVQVTDVALSNVQPPQKVQAAFADAIKADGDAKRVRSAANAYAQERLPRAKSQATEEIAQAHAYADNVVATAQGDKARFDAVLGEYQKAPQATRDRLYADTLRDIIRTNRVVVVGTGSHGVHLNLTLASPPSAPTPVSSSSSAPPAAAAATPAPEAAAPAPSLRSRDRTGAPR
ncbi:MAG TPA: FtsH protease activity modulator HflK [Nevskiaceae bacterium]|nr:FtsH protease activity modulator HflK [Nevskiaceae bacterium]